MLLKALILNHCTLALPTELIYAYLGLVSLIWEKACSNSSSLSILQTYSLPTLGLSKKSNQRTFTPELAHLDVMAAGGHRNVKQLYFHHSLMFWCPSTTKQNRNIQDDIKRWITEIITQNCFKAPKLEIYTVYLTCKNRYSSQQKIRKGL